LDEDQSTYYLEKMGKEVRTSSRFQGILEENHQKENPKERKVKWKR